MRVRGQASAADFAAEAFEVLLGQTAFEERTRVDARRGMTLDEHLIAVAAVALAAEEVVEADLVERGGGRVGREVSAEAVEAVVGAVDHDDRVPADERADAAFDVLVAREPRLLLGAGSC